MPIWIDYILKLNICLAVVYLFYQLLLRRLTFYNWNRWYLLGYTVLGFVIPFINIMPDLQKKQLDKGMLVQWIPAIGFETAVKKNFFETLSWWDWAIGIILLGMVVLLLRFVIRLWSLRNITRNAEVLSSARPDDPVGRGQTKIYQVAENISPFSFGNAIYINNELHDTAELEEIISHEFVHVKQKHTIDIIWSELICITNWFNPFVWLLRHSIKQNLEFIADDKVLQKGFDPKEYQYLLLKVMGNEQFAFVNNFNFSSLKKRIIMMNTIKSARIHLIKFLFLLPVIAVLLLSFRKEITRVNPVKAINKKIVQQQVAAVIEKSAANPFIQGTQKDTVPKIKEKVNVEVRKDSILRIKTVPLYIVDGKPASGDILEKIAPDQIESINVLKDDAAVAQFGEQGKNGVIMITMKKNTDNKTISRNTKVSLTDKNGGVVTKVTGDSIYVSGNTITVRGNVTGTVGGESTKLVERKLTTGFSSLPANTYFVINGNEATKEDIEKLNSGSIKSVDVLKDKSATKYYGEKAKNGAIIITTK